MGYDPYAVPLQMWRTGFEMWRNTLQMQTKMMTAFLPRAREAAQDTEETTHEGVDFAQRAAQSLAAQEPKPTGAFPV